MIVTMDYETYLLIEVFKTVGLPILIGVAIAVAFYKIREWIVNKRKGE